MAFANSHIVMGDNRRGYRRLLRVLLRDGEEVEVRGLKTRELTDVTLLFNDPTTSLLPVGIGRRVNTALAAVEALSVIGGVASPELTLRAAPRYADVLVDENDLHYGAYGPRLDGQLLGVARMLSDTQDPMSRQAVMSIWRPEDLAHVGDRPCTLTIQFLRRPPTYLNATGRDQLHMIVHMRSQDMWLGAGMDMFVFGQVRDTLARILGCDPGWYSHHVGSLHLYERNWDDAEKIVGMIGAVEQIKSHVNLPHGLYSGQDKTPMSPTGAQQIARTLLRDRTTKTYIQPDVAELHNPWYARALSRLWSVE